MAASETWDIYVRQDNGRQDYLGSRWSLESALDVARIYRKDSVEMNPNNPVKLVVRKYRGGPRPHGAYYFYLPS